MLILISYKGGFSINKQSYEYLYQQYIVEKKSLKDLCKDLGLKKHQVTHILHKHSIRKSDVYQPLKDSKWLRNKFKSKTTRQIAEELGVTIPKVEYWLQKHNIKQKFKFFINEDKIQMKDPVFCYFAGLVATDGHLDKKVARVTISLSVEGDDVLLEALAKYFEYQGEIYRHGKSGNRYTLCMSSEKIVNELYKMGIDRFSNKTTEVKVPESFFNEDCMRMYIRGCLDGDGNIKSDKGNVRLYCGSNNFVDGLISIIKEKGIEIVKSYVHRSNVSYPGFELKRRPSLELCHWIYKGFEEYKLSRKYQVALDVWGEELVQSTLSLYKGNNMLYKDKDWLQLRVNEGKNMDQIAELCNCCPSVISRWIRLYNVSYITKNSRWIDEHLERNGVSSSSVDWISIGMPYRDKEWLIARLNEGMGIRTISRVFNIDRGTIKKWIKNHDIPFISTCSHSRNLSRVHLESVPKSEPLTDQKSK